MANADLDLDNLPQIAVDPERITPLLPHGLLYNVLMPWRDPTLPTTSFPLAQSGTMPWTIQLETAYHQFHPRLWELLRADDEIDYRYEMAVAGRHYTEVELPGEAAEGQGTELKTAFYRVLDRRLSRWIRIYALHGVRRRYIQQQLAVHPAWTEQDVVKAITTGEGPLERPKAPIHALWPLDTPHPDKAVHRKLISVSLDNSSQYQLFDAATTESQQAYEDGWTSLPKKEDLHTTIRLSDHDGAAKTAPVALPAATKPSRRRRADVEGDLHSECLDAPIVNISMVQMVKQIFRLPNVRRAPGKAGQLAHFHQEVAGTPCPIYIDAKQTIWPLPLSFSILYDLE